MERIAAFPRRYETLRVSILEFEKTPAKKHPISSDWWLYWKLRVGRSLQHKTASRRDGVWNETTVVVDLSEPLALLLFAYGRIKSEIVGIPLVLSIETISIMLGCDDMSTESPSASFWFQYKGASGEILGDVRLAFAFARSSEAIKRQIVALMKGGPEVFETIQVPDFEQELEDDDDTAIDDETYASYVIESESDPMSSSKLYLASAYELNAYEMPASDDPALMNYVPIEDGPSASWVARADTSDDYAFNRLWQEQFSQLVASGGAQNSENLSVIADLSASFVEEAETYAKIIINERNLPAARKTIRADQTKGGVLGGEKFVVRNIMFKFASNVFGLDGHAGAKIAGHELKSATAITNAITVLQLKVCLPFLMLIDYKGARLLALSLCPINSNTLVHGSGDGGKTISASRNHAPLLKSIGNYLNLRTHQVRGLDIHLAVDAELHVSPVDDRLYLVDLSRVFPPEAPRPDLKLLSAPHLYRLLRSELVAANMHPLCSDSYSGFLAPGDARTEYHRDVQGASKRLRSFAMPWAALQIDQLFASHSEFERFYSLSILDRIRNVTHVLGVNCRYLASVFTRARNISSKRLLLIEMTSRTVKRHVREVLRQSQLSGGFDRALMKSIVTLFNEIFTRRSVSIWDSTIAPELQAYFGNLDLRPIDGAQLLTELHAIPNAFSLIFHRANEALKFKLSRRALEIVHAWDTEFPKNLTPRSASKSRRKLSVSRNATLVCIGQGAAAAQSESWFMDNFSLTEFLLQDFEFGMRSKVNDVAALCTGLDFLTKSSANERGDKSESSHFRSLARLNLTSALNSNSNHPLAAGKLAQILFLDTLDRYGLKQTRMCLAGHWFTADVRYCEFLWTSAISNSGKSTWILAENLRQFANFLLTGPSHLERATWVLASSIYCLPEGTNRSDENDIVLLKSLLCEIGMQDAAESM